MPDYMFTAKRPREQLRKGPTIKTQDVGSVLSRTIRRVRTVNQSEETNGGKKRP